MRYLEPSSFLKPATYIANTAKSEKAHIDKLRITLECAIVLLDAFGHQVCKSTYFPAWYSHPAKPDKY